MEEDREQLSECNGEQGISSSDEEEEEGEYIGYQRLDLAGAGAVMDGRESDHEEEGLEGYVMLAQDEDSSEREQQVVTTVQDRDGRGRREEAACTPAAPMGDGECLQ